MPKRNCLRARLRLVELVPAFDSCSNPTRAHAHVVAAPRLYQSEISSRRERFWAPPPPRTFYGPTYGGALTHSTSIAPNKAFAGFFFFFEGSFRQSAQNSFALHFLKRVRHYASPSCATDAILFLLWLVDEAEAAVPWFASFRRRVRAGCRPAGRTAPLFFFFVFCGICKTLTYKGFY